jgi:hypothetical protein
LAKENAFKASTSGSDSSLHDPSYLSFCEESQQLFLEGFHHLREVAISRHGETVRFFASSQAGAAEQYGPMTLPLFFTGS